MKDIENLDDQLLGSFVDGELDVPTSEAVIQAMEDDPVVRERVYRLRRAKDLMRLGFGDAQPPTEARGIAKRSPWRNVASRIAASVAALAISFGAGMLGHHYYAAEGDQQLRKAHVPAAQQQDDRIILHISESDPEQFAAALSFAETFLDEHRASGNQVAVVANAGGLDLLRTGHSAFGDRIVALINSYPNVHFIACADGIRALRAQGVEPEFIHAVDTGKPAIDQIVGRVQAGWTYIKVESLLKT